MVGLLHAMAFMVFLLGDWVIWNNKPLSLYLKYTTVQTIFFKKLDLLNYTKQKQWLRIRLWVWILKFENLFICHLWRNSNARQVCNRLGRKKLNVKDKPNPNLNPNRSPNLTLTLKRKIEK